MIEASSASKALRWRMGDISSIEVATRLEFEKGILTMPGGMEAVEGRGLLRARCIGAGERVGMNSVAGALRCSSYTSSYTSSCTSSAGYQAAGSGSSTVYSIGAA